jgi:hypothetical protein
MQILRRMKKGSHVDTPMFLKLRSGEPQGSTKMHQGFRETKMDNVGRILLSVQTLYVRITISVATFDNNQSFTYSTQTVNRFFNPEVSLFRSPVSQHRWP